MTSTATKIATTVLATSALVPAAALASHAVSHPKLGGAPQMFVVDSHHATLKFASDHIKRTHSGRVDARITFVNGARVTSLKPSGTHAGDIVYTAKVSSKRALREGAKYTVRFRLGDSNSVKRLVKLHAAG
jgi:hypothetical protein